MDLKLNLTTLWCFQELLAHDLLTNDLHHKTVHQVCQCTISRHPRKEMNGNLLNYRTARIFPGLYEKQEKTNIPSINPGLAFFPLPSSFWNIPTLLFF